jgi:CSLREA domain-containing protein
MPCRIRRSALAGSVAALIASAPAALFAVTFAVNSPGDGHDASLDGVCETAPGNGICTLRAAIEEANGGGGPNPVVLIPPMTIGLSFGFIIVARPMTIEGAGMHATILQPSNFTVPALVIEAPTVIRDLRIQNFVDNGSSGYGGAIFAAEALTVERCEFEGNTAWTAGGAIATWFGSLQVSDSNFLRNGMDAAWSVTGGALYLQGVGNRIDSSYFDGNHTYNGGAIYEWPGTELTIVNSTFVNNKAQTYGGALSLALGPGSTATANVLNSTFSRNDADSDRDGSGQGGAIYATSTDTTVNLWNSILSDNAETALILGLYHRFSQECHAVISTNGYDIVRFNDGGCTIGGSTSSADPQLEPAAYHGGWTPTMAIPATSPAIGAGFPLIFGGCYDELHAPLATDQRGAARPYGGECDLGAFEWGAWIFDDGFEAGDGSHWSARAP